MSGADLSYWPGYWHVGSHRVPLWPESTCLDYPVVDLAYALMGPGWLVDYSADCLLRWLALLEQPVWCFWACHGEQWQSWGRESVGMDLERMALVVATVDGPPT
ncbi:hypothetical protein FOMG_18721 [Fusarium oxysporum f. sp. melonis 26406]|uniref:Uncharacterized protein n=1 Tax=Fusarium oxysporum f. sp. melonis 26406 TaxID=1089452 RepID=W9YYF5_FUSOX|nr:hypothetical protein FOMG_18721 [Fusarium oxysporum f. sp. melonis 26406]